MNKTRLNSFGWPCAVLVVLLLANKATAEDLKIYESLPQVAIGKVFFSPLQRDRFDKLRNNTPAQTNASRRTGVQGQKVLNKNAAGFWSSSRGLSKVYAAGDFVEADGTETKSFPGDVKVARRDDSPSDESDDVEK